ncbi:ATP-binding protein, partial [Streptomyces sp. NPDC047014]|uniref:ATP-binding protein n=1 Tax=Streptomyces sp. NPDC047014 TaxID=3155736 RepID=UPI003404270A
LEDRAQQLSLASKYKSEFLANMSHELRTPLNSLLILAQLLAQNPTRNLTPKQVEYAGIIHSAGSDLLQLINDILDLSKVEAGKMDVNLERVSLKQLLNYLEASFRPVTSQKGLEFDITTAPGVPVDLLTDDARLQQILRNLLSNAVKFTEHGRVHVKIEPAASAELPDELAQAGSVVAFRVIDSGIGIAEQQLEAIFAAFQQADGTTSRKYGGTGLGLSITREIARLLGGAVTARSELGKGSTFTLYLPVSGREPTEEGPAALESAAPDSSGAAEPDSTAQPALEEQRHPRRILVIEQRSNGLLSLVAESAAGDLTAGRAVTVPADRAEVVTAVTAADAAAALAQAPFHCVVLELGSDGEGLRFLKALGGDSALASLPVLAHDNRRMTREQQAELAERAAVQPLEVLSSLDELRERIALHLSADRPGDVPTLVRADDHLSLEHAVVDASLAGRSVLVVDDDPRNLYAISGILELHGIHVLHAENGRRGIETLTGTPGIDLILMDVMMPELDGYAATTEIRRMPEYSTLPIISVTAKAMPGDREKSLASGANDYVTKPVDANDLIARLRRWLPHQSVSGPTPA